MAKKELKVYEGVDSPLDMYGRECIRFKGYYSVRDIFDWLYHHYPGYKFAIVFDTTKDEWYDIGTEAVVYFLDEILLEAAAYSDATLIRYGKTIYQGR